jgi:hypothetical protein
MNPRSHNIIAIISSQAFPQRTQSLTSSLVTFNRKIILWCTETPLGPSRRAFRIHNHAIQEDHFGTGFLYLCPIDFTTKSRYSLATLNRREFKVSGSQCHPLQPSTPAANSKYHKLITFKSNIVLLRGWKEGPLDPSHHKYLLHS